MKEAENDICPRCDGPVPNSEHIGEYPGALSRVADVEICSLCGEDEALAIIFTGGKFNGLVPQEAWPIDYRAMYERMASIIDAQRKFEESR